MLENASGSVSSYAFCWLLLFELLSSHITRTVKSKGNQSFARGRVKNKGNGEHEFFAIQ